MQTTICDICGTETKRPATRIVVNRTISVKEDPKDIVEYFDLCIACELDTLRLALKKFSIDHNSEFGECHSDIIKDRIRANK